MTNHDQGDLLFEEAHSPSAGAPASNLPKPTKAWNAAAAGAVATAKWKTLNGEQQEELLSAMWVYASARSTVSGAPLRADESEQALLGWVNKDLLLASAVRLLNTTQGFLGPSEIPPVVSPG